MSRKVLIVDESTSVRDMLGEALQGAGYEVNAVDDGRRALELIGVGDYDLLLTDLNSPEISGLELIDEVRKIPGRRFLPIVVLSSRDRAEVGKACLLAGASACLQKPLDREEVETVLDTLTPY